MRASLAVLLGTLALLATPSAFAASSSLAFDDPGDVTAGTTVPLKLTLRAKEFLCQENRFFEVVIDMTPSSNQNATLDSNVAYFPVRPRSYFVDDYVVNATVNLTLGANAEPGTVALIATFRPDDACFAPGGFSGATANLTLQVAPSGGAVEPVTPGNGTTQPVTPTPATNETPTTNSTPTPATPATPTRTGGPVCGPDGNCGPIGEYEPPAAQESSADVPAPGIALVAAAAAGVALWRRK